MFFGSCSSLCAVFRFLCITTFFNFFVSATLHAEPQTQQQQQTSASRTEAQIIAEYQALLKKYDLDLDDVASETSGKRNKVAAPKKSKIDLEYERILKQQGLDASDFGRKEKSVDTRAFTLSEQSQQTLLAQMVWVEGGSFIMGSNAPEATNREKPAHTVILDGFFILETEVTQALFEELMGWNTSYFTCEKCPMNNVSWTNIQLFIERLNTVTGKQYRLPTEAEWEYAAKGGVKSKGYRFSGSNNIDDVAWYAENGERKSHEVAQKQANELGLYDMTGNLWEFVLDDMSRAIYTKEARVNPVNVKSNDPSKKSMKVIRGGGYEFSSTESLVFKRDGATNNVRMPDIGFRLALTLK